MNRSVTLAKNTFLKLTGTVKDQKTKKKGKKGRRVAPLSAPAVYLYLKFVMNEKNEVIDLTYRHIAKELGISSTTLVTTFDWLEANGLIKKAPTEAPVINRYIVKN